MIVEVLEHDLVTGDAKIKFSHNDIVHEDNYNLKLVVPGTTQLLEKLKKEFTEEIQLKALDILTAQVQKDIESGALKNKME